MIKISHVKGVANLTLPQEIIDVVATAVTILDTEFGEHRDVDSGDGGEKFTSTVVMLSDDYSIIIV